jgi:Fe-S-cluster containining protein
MRICEKCDIRYKVEYCCGSHPETTETKELKLPDGTVLGACPNLDTDGLCRDYEKRPPACMEYNECPKLSSTDLCDLLGFD